MKANRLSALVVGVFVASAAYAQFENEPPSNGGKPLPAALSELAYIKPPTAIESLVAAPWYKNVSLSNLSPDAKVFLVPVSSGPTTLADIARPYVNLAGEKLDVTGNRSRTMNLRGASGYNLFDPLTGTSRALKVPKNARLNGAEFSPDGSKIAFYNNEDNGTTILIADVKSGNVTELTDRALASGVAKLQWVDKGNRIVTVLVPKNRAPLPNGGPVPSQPRVQLTDPSKNRIPTYRGLMETKHHEDLYEYCVTGQLAVIEVGSKRIQEIGKPAMIQAFDASPDGKYFRVTTTLRPFSFEVLASSFGQKEEIWDAAGKALTELSSRELRVGSPPTPPQTTTPTGPGTGQRGPGGRGGGQGGAQSGAPSNDKRSIVWRPDGAGLSFLQSEPAPARTEGGADEGQGGSPFQGGNPAQGAQRRKDRVMLWTAPFGKDDVKVVYEAESTIGSVQYSPDCGTLFLTSTANGTETLVSVNLKDAEKKQQTLYSERTGGPNASGPGNLVLRDNENGRPTVRISASGLVFLSGTQNAPENSSEGPRPFLDSIDLATAKKTRIWQGAADVYETLSGILDDNGTKLVLNRQSATQVPNNFLWEQLSSQPPKRLTENLDYAPNITQARRERIQVTRPDGIKFWVEVTLPRNYANGTKLPAFFWFYPREYTDQAAYDRSVRNRNPNQFQSLSMSSKDYLIEAGYALVEPDCPIIGDQGRMNDSYVPDLRANLWAVIDTLDKKGFIDRDRLALGGHSYGAFSTANAMIHTPYFKAGIAGDGNYNRMLTPAGFQSERRLLWEARETYLSMSPLLYAEQMTGALLMYHGLDDQNQGTDPINSERLFHTLQNLGKTAGLYMYPYEDHGPVAIETHLDLWARWVAWLDKYVMGK